ncbi:(3R)-3-hydroxyacyl-CoA dehydrogenase-like [Rhipicephalus microplus]|uniref:(3R)-3-hydroxyacyl-CoA dehydrogenase-like n=1 Tax=Rhipicephalus microplus TaxID=6941 RepID=UPI003F6D974E
MSLRGRLALVTGGASSIGRATCHALASHGVRVIVADLDGNAAKVVASELPGCPKKGDLLAYTKSITTSSSIYKIRGYYSREEVDKLFTTVKAVVGTCCLTIPQPLQKRNFEEAYSSESTQETYSINSPYVSDTSSVNILFTDIKETEPISIVVNCAGILKRSPLVDTTDDDFDKVLQVNLKGTFLVTRAAARAMITSGVKEGVIVNVASVLAKTGLSGLVAYTASKGGVVSLTKSVAQELAQHGIRCNAVLPSLTQTAMSDAQPEEPKRACIALTPLGRICQPYEVSEAIVFLCSPKSSFVTGATLEVTGGCRM